MVNVYAEKVVQRNSLFEGDPFFEEFFGQQMPNRTQKQSSLGSGVIIDESGLVITNNHVINGATTSALRFSDGREFAAKLLMKDGTDRSGGAPDRGRGVLRGATLGIPTCRGG